MQLLVLPDKLILISLLRGPGIDVWSTGTTGGGEDEMWLRDIFKTVIRCGPIALIL